MMRQDPLGEALAAAKGRLFAVVDAAHFEFLQDQLALARLDFEPLYLDEIDAPTIASGPHLVRIRKDHDIAVVRQLIGDAPACVWWVWPDTPTAKDDIYRHLRGLNMVEIPRDRYDQDVDAERGPGYEAVLFRHADPNVMMAMLPVLYPEQVARLFGAAKSIIVDAPDYETVRAFDAPDDLPSAPRGMLRIASSDQYEALSDAQTEESRLTAMEGLRECYPDFTDEFDDDSLREIVLRAENSGNEIGILSEKAHFCWACMYLLTKGDIEENVPDLARDFAGLQIGVDAAIEAMFSEFQRELEALVG